MTYFDFEAYEESFRYDKNICILNLEFVRF